MPRRDYVSSLYKRFMSLPESEFFLFVDRIALVRDELARLLATCRARQFPITVVGAERENEWHIYCENLVPFTSLEFSIAYLTKEEIIDLLAVLERHRALGLLADRTQIVNRPGIAGGYFV